MKKTMVLLAMACGLAAASCKKAYECQDQATEIITGEVHASSQSEADKLCNQNGTNTQIAKQK